MLCKGRGLKVRLEYLRNHSASLGVFTSRNAFTMVDQIPGTVLVEAVKAVRHIKHEGRVRTADASRGLQPGMVRPHMQCTPQHDGPRLLSRPATDRKTGLSPTLNREPASETNMRPSE